MCLQIKINQSINLRLSNTNYREMLLINNSNKNFTYGFSAGISIISQKNSIFDMAISSLGSGGYIYGITMHF